jgi:hypothetical protein
MYRGIGFRSASRSWIGKQSEREGEKVDDEQLNSDRDSWAKGMEKTYLSVGNGRTEQGGKVLVALLLLVPGFPPLGDGLSMEDEDVEEGVEEEDGVRLDGDRVEQDGEGFGVDGVRHEGRLDHNEGIVDVFSVQDVTGSLKRYASQR